MVITHDLVWWIMSAFFVIICVIPFRAWLISIINQTTGWSPIIIGFTRKNKSFSFGNCWMCTNQELVFANIKGRGQWIQYGIVRSVSPSANQKAQLTRSTNQHEACRYALGRFWWFWWNIDVRVMMGYMRGQWLGSCYAIPLNIYCQKVTYLYKHRYCFTRSLF